MWGPKQTIQTTPTQVSDRTWATHFCSHINSLKECKIFHIFHFYNLKWFWNYKFVFLNIKCRNQRDKLPFPPACVWHRNSTVSRLNVYVTLLFSLFSYFRLRWKLCCDVYCVFYTKKEPVFPTLKILVGKFKFQERQPSARTTAFNSRGLLNLCDKLAATRNYVSSLFYKQNSYTLVRPTTKSTISTELDRHFKKLN